jgi:hypothetical protein
MRHPNVLKIATCFEIGPRLNFAEKVAMEPLWVGARVHRTNAFCKIHKIFFLSISVHHYGE